MDIDQLITQDMNLSATGDLNAVDGTTRGQQRILRRLLTNPAYVQADGTLTVADYIFHPDYGAGLGRFVGTSTPLSEISALITAQLALEDVVDPNTPPVVTLAWLDPTTLNCIIQYVDASSGQNVVLNFDVNNQ